MNSYYGKMQKEVFMIKAKDLKKAFVKITEKKKKELFYADNGI